MGFTPNKKNANDFNGGVQYKNGDSLQAESLNHIIEGLLYAQENGNGGGSGGTGADGRMGAIQLLLEYDGEDGNGYHLYVLKCLDTTVQEEDFDGMVGMVGLVTRKTRDDVDDNLSIGDIVSITGVKDRHLVCNTDDGGEVFGNIRGEKGEQGEKGDTGADGYTPVKGVDYFTEEDKEEIATEATNRVDLSWYTTTAEFEQLKADLQDDSGFDVYRATYADYASIAHNDGEGRTIAETYATKDEIAKLEQLKPEFANNIEECTDTSKLYVLPDGYIYAYMLTEIEGGAAYTNLAEPLPDNTTDTTKWVNGYRLGSSSVSATSGKTITNPIEMKVGDVIRVKGVSFADGVDRVALMGNDKTSVYQYNYVSDLPSSVFGYNLNGDVHEFTILSFSGDCKYFRCAFNTPTDPSTVIITKNEEIKETEPSTGYAWANTGHAFVPADYEDRIISLEEETREHSEQISEINERIENVKTGDSVPTFWESAIATAKEKIIAKQDLGGANCVNFVWTSDIHASASIDEKGKRFGIVAKAIMDEVDIPLFVSTGDLMSQSSHADVSKVYEEEALVKKWLSLISYERQALIMGNHDGAWGDTTSGYYCKQLPLEVMYNLIYRKQAMDFRRVSGDNGTYYYIDNVSQKMRFILLNSNNTPSYEENADGTAKYDRFHKSCLCQEQYDWLINIALDMPEGYTSCIFLHEPYVGGWALLVGVVDAYNNKGAYSNSFTDSENAWRNSTVNVNFANAKGTIAGVFAGHTHIDTIRNTDNNPMYSTCPLIITTNSLGGEVRDGTTRTENTDTEFAMDIVTVDTKNRKIYMTRLGAGSSRETEY